MKQNEGIVTEEGFVDDGASNLPTEKPVQRFTRRTRALFTKSTWVEANTVVWKFARFMGPGAIIAVAYIDPDNYQTAVTAGVEFKYKLLFVILFTNVVSIYLQVSAKVFRVYPRRTQNVQG